MFFKTPPQIYNLYFMSKKIFILDTNVILHDYKSIYCFEENDIIIPIVVLEELDRFKKGSDLINFYAREFMRELDSIAGDHLLNEGIPLGKDKGLLYIETGKEFSDTMKKSFSESTADHRILAVADYINQQHTNRKVVLVTQDINLRMKAKSLGILAQDFESGKVQDITGIFRDVEIYEHIDSELIQRFYQNDDGLPIEDFNLEIKTAGHKYFVLRNEKSSALAHYDPVTRTIYRVEKHRCAGIIPRNAEQTFALDILLNPNIKLATITGKAGTGKTLLALAAAMHQVKKFQQIFLARPIIALANRDIGFLPGNAKEKIKPFMQPLFDNLTLIKHQYSEASPDYKKIEDMVNKEKLLITPLAYIRGRSLSNIFFIVDEAQNLTPHEIKTIITRAGEGTKMIFTGDIQQIDSPYLDAKSNGLSYLTDRMEGQNIFAHINLIKGERSDLAELASNLL